MFLYLVFYRIVRLQSAQEGRLHLREGLPHGKYDTTTHSVKLYVLSLTHYVRVSHVNVCHGCTMYKEYMYIHVEGLPQNRLAIIIHIIHIHAYIYIYPVCVLQTRANTQKTYVFMRERWLGIAMSTKKNRLRSTCTCECSQQTPFSMTIYKSSCVLVNSC